QRRQRSPHAGRVLHDPYGAGAPRHEQPVRARVVTHALGLRSYRRHIHPGLVVRGDGGNARPLVVVAHIEGQVAAEGQAPRRVAGLDQGRRSVTGVGPEIDHLGRLVVAYVDVAAGGVHGDAVQMVTVSGRNGDLIGRTRSAGVEGNDVDGAAHEVTHVQGRLV